MSDISLDDAAKYSCVVDYGVSTAATLTVEGT